MYIRRYEFRASLTDENSEPDFTINSEFRNKINTLSVFKYKRDLYLYVEIRVDAPKSEEYERAYEVHINTISGKPFNPSDIFPGLDASLAIWPVNDGAKWIYMNPMFYHAIPAEEASWNKDRKPDRIKGRIATVYDNEVSSYVYYHRALVNEGLLKGDKYHFISLNGNILFSYFEEPKTFVNLSGREEASEIINDYLDYGESNVFKRREGSDLNFEFIDCVFHI